MRNVGYGAIVLQLEGCLALAPLVNPLSCPGRGALDRFASVVPRRVHCSIGTACRSQSAGTRGKLAWPGYGVQDVRRRTPMSEYTVFAVGSLAKMLTGAAVMQLEERGKLRLDDPLVKHVPWFHMADPRYRHITIRSLLTHTAGLPEATFDSLTREFAQRWRDEGALERMACSLDGGLLLSQEPAVPNAEFRYSGIGYGLLGVLIQEISGEVFEDYMRRHILEPLQMVNSTFLLDEVRPQNLAAAHTRGPDGQPVVCEPFPYTRHFGPAVPVHQRWI